MNNERDLTAYARKELEINGMVNTNYGDAIIKFIKEIDEVTKSDKFILNNINKMLDNLFNRLPVTPIVETDFDNVEKDEALYVKCPRYSYVYRNKDNEYMDERGITFIDSLGNMHWTDKSLIKITLPYIPMQQYIKV